MQLAVDAARRILSRIMGTPTLPPSTDLLPGWRDRALLDRLIEAHRPPRVSLRTISATLASVAAGVALLLAGWVAVRYTAMVQSCTEEAARYPDASAYCEATPVLSSSGSDPRSECQRYRGDSTLEVCVRQSPIHPRNILSLAVLAVGFSVVALLLAWWWWLARRSFPPFVGVLQRRARDVCWVFVRTTTYTDPRMPSVRRVSSVLVLALASRHMFEIGAVSPADAEELALSVAPMVPWATLGHSALAQAAFSRDPRSLYRT